MLSALVFAVTLSTPEAFPMRACFTEHLVDAIEQNLERLPAYAWRSDGASLQISSSLIAGEAALVPVALAFDAHAHVLLGEGGLCDLFEPMTAARPHVVTARSDDLDVSALGRALKDAARARAFHEAGTVLDSELVQARQGCMLRHTLESARRTARVAERKACETHGLYGNLLVLHAAGLPVVDRLDAQAAALHAAGVPILCDDVPAISPLPATH